MNLNVLGETTERYHHMALPPDLPVALNNFEHDRCA